MRPDPSVLPSYKCAAVTLARWSLSAVMMTIEPLGAVRRSLGRGSPDTLYSRESTAFFWRIVMPPRIGVVSPL